MTERCWGPCVPDDECTPSIWGPRPADLFAGVWLFGWEGDLPHYSVLRFPPEVDAALEGDVELLADPGIDINTPYFPCAGVGSFGPGERFGTFVIEPPPECSMATTNLVLTFIDFADPPGRWGSTLRATVETSDGNSIEAYWFPADTCDTPMTRCAIGGWLDRV